MNATAFKSTQRRSRQRAFDRYFGTEIAAAERDLQNVERREVAANGLLLRECAFIANDDFATCPVAEVVNPDRCGPIFIERQEGLGKSGIIDQMAAKRLLTTAGETFLFRRMNFLLFWGNALRSTLKQASATARSIARIRVLFLEARHSRSQIVDASLRLVLSLARKFSNSDSEFEDLVSEGSLILVKAASKFDFARGFRFSTYATHSIQRHFYRRWQTQQRQSRLVLTSAPEVLAELVPAAEPGPADKFDEVDMKPIMDCIGSHLDEREQHIVLERFGLGPSGVSQTLRSLAAELGISKERVRQLQIKAMAKLQELTLMMFPSDNPGASVNRDHVLAQA